MAVFRVWRQRIVLIELNPSAQVTLLEASDRLGGTIQTEHRDGFLLERGPDSFISEKPQALALAKRLGLESQLIQTNEEYRRSFIVRNGRLRAVPEGFQLLAPSRMWPFHHQRYFQSRGKGAHGRRSVSAAKEHERHGRRESLRVLCGADSVKKRSNAWPNRWSAAFTLPIRKR